MRKPLQADKPKPKQSDKNNSINASVLSSLKNTINPALILFRKKNLQKIWHGLLIYPKYKLLNIKFILWK